MMTKETVSCLVIFCVASLCRTDELNDSNTNKGIEVIHSPTDPNKYEIKFDSPNSPDGFKFKFDTKINLTLNGNIPTTNEGDGPISVKVASWNSADNKPLVFQEIPVVIPSSTTTTSPPIQLDERIKDCGKRQLDFNALITNAQPTKPGDWPWHAAIYKTRSVTASDQNYVCGGTLISKRIVITAGHCVVENGIKIIPERIFVVLGKYNIVGSDPAPQEKEVFEIILRESFSVRTLKNDIALLKLASEVGYGDYVQPICLWDRSKTDKSLIVGKIGTVVGWGITEMGVISKQLGLAKMPVASDFDCLKSYPLFYERFLNAKTYCAGFRNGTSVCNGDSGGGMYFEEDTPDGGTVWTLRGLVSVSVSRRNTRICDSTNYAVFTDIAKHLEWIDANE